MLAIAPLTLQMTYNLQLFFSFTTFDMDIGYDIHQAEKSQNKHDDIAKQHLTHQVSCLYG